MIAFVSFIAMTLLFITPLYHPIISLHHCYSNTKSTVSATDAASPHPFLHPQEEVVGK
jgi:hypothetical protein